MLLKLTSRTQQVEGWLEFWCNFCQFLYERMLQELPQRGYFNGEELKHFTGEISKMIS